MPEKRGHLDGRVSGIPGCLACQSSIRAAQFNLGEIDAGSGRIFDAIDHFRDALRLDPDYALAHYFLGLALLAKGRCDEVWHGLPCRCRVP